MPTPAAKRRIAAATSAIMYNPGLLDATFSNLVGQGLFVTAVCKQWQQSYARAAVKTSKDPHETLYRAAFESAPRILVAVHSYKLDLNNDEVLHLAGLHADAKTLRRAFALGMPMKSAVVTGAAESGRLSTLQCAHSLEKCPLPKNIAAIAARLGDIAMLAWLLRTGNVLLRGDTMRAALIAGHIDVLDLLHEVKCEEDAFACDSVANAEVAQWLYENKSMRSKAELKRISYSAAEAGKLDVLQWTKQKGVPFTTKTMEHAAGAVNHHHHAIPTMQYLLHQGCPIDTDDCYSAAVVKGSVHVLEWLTQEHSAVFAEESLQVAAYEGHIDVCAYLRQQGCPWTAAACTAAVSRQKFDMLK
jgi:hypothetical protein